MNTRRLVGAMAAFGLAGAGTGGLLVAGAAPAEAFTGDCSGATPAATLVADGVCEVRFTGPGSFSFTAPSGITKLSAVLVAAGGGAFHSTQNGQAYAGSGGGVIYIDSVPAAGTVAGVVGAGGAAAQSTADTATVGGDTSIAPASGPSTSVVGGRVGYDAFSTAACNGTFTFGYGYGARTDPLPTPDCTAGVGYALSDLALDPALFPAASLETDRYGDGGIPTDAGPVAVSAIAGNGGAVNDLIAAAGSPGLVIFRFAPAPRLAATGSPVSAAVPALSAAMIAAGGLLLALRRRRAQGASGR